MSSVDLALQAFEARPVRAEPLHDLAKHYRERGMNHIAMLFAEAGMKIPRPDDALFVEDNVYRYGFREEVSIAGFYTDREAGHRACDHLATDRSVPAHVRDLAWNNLFFYTKPLKEQAPSFKTQRAGFNPPEEWRPTNPSVYRWGNQTYLNIRTVNYLIGQDGRYQLPQGHVATRNWLFTLNDELVLWPCGELLLPPDMPCVFHECVGLEDLRLFSSENSLWCSGTTRQISPEGWCDLVVARIREDCRLADWHVMKPQSPRRPEKNWIPIIGTRAFIYSMDPFRLADWEGNIYLDTTPAIALDKCGGSTQAIPFDGGYLVMVHERIAVPGLGQRRYQRRFIQLDQNLEIKAVSRRFYFGDGEGEFSCGMCIHPDGKRLVISYGVLDREAWIATVDLADVRKMLGGETAPASQGAAPSPSVAPALSRTETSSVSWVDEQINRPLRHADEYEKAHARLVELGWPTHRDRPKDWDNLIAVSLAAQFCEKHHHVVDAGGTRDSAFLPGLQRLGYTNLVNYNLDEERPYVVENGIRWIKGDITDTRRDEASADFVACLSVIEHGVSWRAFLDEMARIVRQGGRLFVSFDYWETKIDAGDRMAFGAPVKIFDHEETSRLIFYANNVGFKLAGKHDLTCRDRVVNWVGLDFTFMNLLFRRV